MNHPRKIALSLFVVGLLVGACNQNLPPPPPLGSGGGGLGSAGTGGFRDPGVGGQAGFGGAGGGDPGGGSMICTYQSHGCVSSCTTAPFVYFPSDCVAGAVTCPPGSVSLATCDPNACAQRYQECCDDVTGEITPVVCSSDGLVLHCPGGLRNILRYCVPAILGISSCEGLAGTPCSLDGQQCYSGGTACTCGNAPGTDAGLTWDCPPLLP